MFGLFFGRGSGVGFAVLCLLLLGLCLMRR